MIRRSLLWAGVALSIAASAAAEPVEFEASLTAFTGSMPGAVLQPLAPVTAHGTVSYEQSGFSLPAGIFTTNRFTPIATSIGGTVPLPTTFNAIYSIGQVLNQSSGAGTLAVGQGPREGFGGTLDSGAALNLLLGISPLGITFASVLVPLPVGASTTAVQKTIVLGNIVTVSVFAGAWTTGTIHYDDRSKGTLNASGRTIFNRTVTTGTARGGRELGPTGGFITLVSPVVIRVPGTGADLLAGYAVLDISFGAGVSGGAPVPEPGTLLLFGGAVALLAQGWARRRS